MNYDYHKETYWFCDHNGWHYCKSKDKFEIDRKRDNSQQAEKRSVFIKDHKVIKTVVTKYQAGPS